jgi:hypothetical protein
MRYWEDEERRCWWRVGVVVGVLLLLVLMGALAGGCTVGYRVESAEMQATLAKTSTDEVTHYHNAFVKQLELAEESAYQKAIIRMGNLVRKVEEGGEFSGKSPQELVRVILTDGDDTHASLQDELGAIQQDRVNEQERFDLIKRINSLIVRIAAQNVIIAHREVNDLEQIEALAEQYLWDLFREEEE